MSEERGSYLALFNGVMTGEVRNPITGRVYQRREIMEFYRSLLFKAVKKPIDQRALDMLEMVRSFLEVPSDIHLSLLIEARDSQMDAPLPGPSETMRKEMDATFEKWMAQHIAHQETVRGLFNEYRNESLQADRNGLLDSDFRLIHVDRKAQKEELAQSEDRTKAQALKKFEERFLKP